MLDIIVPVYNARLTLPDLLDSLVAQTKKMFIVTISIDGDGEDYDDILNEYRRRGLKIGVVRSEENGGPGMARQRAFDLDQMCSHVMFVDADDMLNPRAVEVLSSEIQRNSADIILSGIIAESQHQPPTYMDPANTSVTWLHGKIYRSDYLRENNIRFSPNIRLNEDSYFNLVACNCTEKKVRIPEYTYIWRDFKGSLTRSNDGKDFFDKSWEDYVYSQIFGLLEIQRITNDLSPILTAATMINAYHHHMTGIHRDKDCTKVIEYLRAWRESDKIQEILGVKEFWNYILQNTHQAAQVDDDVFFFKMRFCDWLRDFVMVEAGNMLKFKEEKQK